jgi:long-chain fatty acid transport protein
MNVLRPRSLLFLLAFGAPVAARAQGFQLNEIGSCAVGRGQAVTASPCKDPSDIYWNPAAAASLEGWSVYAGIAAISVGGGFTADTSRRFSKGDVPVEFPPNVFVNYGSKDNRWAVGLGVYVPYGLTSQWDNNFPGRFEALKASLASVYFQPNFAYRFAPRWEIGGGPVIGYSQVQLRQSLDLAQQFAQPNLTFGQLGVAAQTEFARAKLTGSGTAVGFNVGIHGALGPDWDVGARYLSQLDFHYDDADATFAQILTNLTLSAGNPLGLPAGTPIDAILSGQFAPGQTLSAQKVSTRIKHPAQFQAGVGWSGLVNTRIEGDFEWTQFSSFDALPLTFTGPASSQSHTLLEDYTNSWSVRIGAEHAFPVGIKGRLGFTYVKSPAPDETVTPLLPDMNRRNYTIGIGVPLSPHYTFDAAYLHVDTSGRRGRIVERTSPDQTALDLNSGFYTLDANVFSLSIRANF